MKISFLFGAGAESAVSSFNIPDGKEFLSKTLFKKNEDYLNMVSEKFDIRKELLIGLETSKIDKNFIKSLLCEYILIFCEVNNINYNNDESFSISDELNNKLSFSNYIGQDNDDFNKRMYRNSSFSDDILYCYNKLLNKIGSVEYLTFQNYIFGENNSKVLSDCLSGLNSEYLKKAYKRIKIDNKLDNLFHNLINPLDYNKKDYYKVLYYYWRCLFVIVGSISNKFNNVENKLTSINDYLQYLIKINDKDCILDMVNSCDCYYKCLLDAFNMNDNKNFQITGFVTTNYTPFIESLSKYSKTYYIHGDLFKYEIAKTLDFLNIDKAIKEKREFFPFIMGMSNLKPIINYKQIKIIYGGFKKINESDVLIIIGYGINENDNHITSMLKEYILKKNKKIIYVTNDSKVRVLEKLKLSFVRYKDKLLCIKYDGKSCKEIIDDVLKKLKEENI